MGAPLVSVITPVHNTVKYLEECIQSVIAQDFAHWEYVILDNASTDGSLQLAQSYANRDPRIRVVACNKLLAQVPNYNRALREVSEHARYVKVLEADNWIFPSCLREMVQLAESNPTVAVVSSYNATETKLRYQGLPLASTVLNGREAARRHLRAEAYLFGAPTTVLMRADLVRDRVPFYPEDGALAEDLSVCFTAFMKWDFGFVHQVLTFVRTDNESILSRIKGFDGQYLDRVVMLERHGSDFFDETELADVRRSVWNTYYRALARGVLERKGDAFWAFHDSGLRSIGRSIDRRKLTAAAFAEATRLALQPSVWLKRPGSAGH